MKLRKKFYTAYESENELTNSDYVFTHIALIDFFLYWSIRTLNHT